MSSTPSNPARVPRGNFEVVMNLFIVPYRAVYIPPKGGRWDGYFGPAGWRENYDFVKILDFGLVKSLEQVARPEPGLTAPNVVSGTPAYLSPESISGEAVDHRSDIYSLGCVAYWMLTGREVFEATGVLQMLARHLQVVPDAPSLHSPFRLPPALEEIVLACLAKRPADRPAGAWELAERLAQVEVGSPWTREDARPWWNTLLDSEAAVTFAD